MVAPVLALLFPAMQLRIFGRPRGSVKKLLAKLNNFKNNKISIFEDLHHLDAHRDDYDDSRG